MTSPTTRPSIRASAPTRLDALVRQAHAPRPEGPAGRRALPHLDRASVVPRAPRPYVWAPAATAGPRPTTGSRPSAGPPGRLTRTAAARTCTRSTPSSPTWTGPQPRPSGRSPHAGVGAPAGGRLPPGRPRPPGEGSRSSRPPARGSATVALEEPSRPRPGSSTFTSRNATDIGVALRPLRAGCRRGAFLVGEVYLRASEIRPSWEIDVAFAFELLQFRLVELRLLRAQIEECVGSRWARRPAGLGALQPRLPAVARSRRRERPCVRRRC